MKRLILILLAFISLSVSAQYTTYTRPIAGKIVYNGAPVLLQTSYVKFMDDAVRITIPNYTSVYNGATDIPLPDNIGNTTGITVSATGSTWQYEYEFDYPTNDTDFVADAFRLMVYMNPGQTKTLSFTLPNTPNRRYKLTWMVYQSSGGDENITKVTIGGVSQTIGGANRDPNGKKSFVLDNPGSSINAVIAGDPNGNYPCINALKIEIYQI